MNLNLDDPGLFRLLEKAQVLSSYKDWMLINHHIQWKSSQASPRIIKLASYHGETEQIWTHPVFFYRVLNLFSQVDEISIGILQGQWKNLIWIAEETFLNS